MSAGLPCVKGCICLRKSVLFEPVRELGVFWFRYLATTNSISRTSKRHTDVADYGLQINTKVFTAQEEPADPYIASLLGIEEGDMVLRLERARYVENVAVICSIDIVR